MGVKIGFIFIVVFATCLADPIPIFPTPTFSHDSDLFLHSDAESRIVGGTQAPEGTVPYMVAMSNGLLVRSFVCGGSIITQRSVLTAAHCIEAVFSFGSLSSTLRVTVGTNRWNSGGQTYSLLANATHPHYRGGNFIKNDIGLLITSTNILFSNRVAPAILNYDWVGAGVASRVAGWGRIRAGGALSATLLELITNTIAGDVCQREVARRAAELNINNVPHIEPEIEICTFHSEGHGTCNGDSGSALVRVDRQQQIGIVSWGLPCARAAPDMFVRVSAFRDFITQNVM